MRIQFVGCGDALGSGGRYHTCFHVVGERTNFLIDCGASSLVALRRWSIERNAIDTILLTHFHADHFGGIPFLILDAHFVTKRRRPLTIAGPRGLASWYARAMEVAFAGSTTNKLHFPLTLTEIEAGRAADIGALRVTPFAARHDERAGPCLMLRIEVENRVIAYSGDTEWTDALAAAGRNADLFICEASARRKAIKTHLSLATLEQHLGAIAAKRLVLTHMGDDILTHRDEIHHAMAEDGMVVTL